MSFNKFRKYLPFNDPDKLTLQVFLSLLILVACVISIILERKLNLSEKAVFGGAPATHNISVILGCIVSIPLLLTGDTTAGSSRYTHRLVAYAAVPFMWSGGWILDTAFSFFEDKEINLSNMKLPLQTAIVVLLAIFSGLGGVILQDSFVKSSQVLPENTIECWDALEESGSLALISRENNIGEPIAGNIIISGQLIPPLKGIKYYSLLKTGDGSRIPDTPPQTFKAVLETLGLR